MLSTSTSAVQVLHVLADALPRMLSAMSSRGSPPLGGITTEVANLLNAEICSIWLLDEAGQSLVLREAEGYKADAIGKPHNMEGLTGRILREKCQFILNFSVQDPELGWRGFFDDVLETHCWSLLGVPIVSSSGDRKPLGVLKLENKRRPWSTREIRQELFKICSRRKVCTAKSLHDDIVSLANQLRTEPNTSSEKQVLKLSSLAGQLREASERIRFVLEPEQTKSTFPTPSRSEASIYEEQLAFQIECIRRQLGLVQDELRLAGNTYRSLKEEICEVASSAEVLDKAFANYAPFTWEDLLLARTIAAMIAAVLDIDRAAYIHGWDRIRHALDNVPSNFLWHVDRAASLIVEGLPKPQPDLLESLKIAYRSALVVDGTKELFRHAAAAKSALSYTVEEIASEVESRSGFYVRLGRLKGFDVSFRPEFSPAQGCVAYYCVYPLLRGSLDVLVDNALQHGSTPVKIRLFEEEQRLVIEVRDNGSGLPENFEIGRGLQYGPDRSGSGVGLFSALHAMQSFQGDLRYERLTAGAVFKLVLVPKASVLTTNYGKTNSGS